MKKNSMKDRSFQYPPPSNKSIGTILAEQARAQNFFNDTDAIRDGQRPNRSFSAGISREDIMAGALSRATLSISGESLTSVSDLPGFVVPNRRRLRVYDALSKGATNASQVRYLREATYTNAATRVAEGAAKPAATVDLEQVSDTVEKIAVTVKVTDEMLADFPATESYLNTALADMVLQQVDSKCISGSGSSDIRGILNVTNVQTVAATYGSGPIDAMSKAIENVENLGNASPNLWIMHPTDHGNVCRSKDANGQYFAGGPLLGSYGGMPANRGLIFGVPVAVTTAISQGTALVGAFDLGATLFIRSGLMVTATNSNEDDFIRNLVCLRAEMRCTLATFKPLAFCQVTGIPLPA